MSATYMKPDQDCMGNPTPGYWRECLVCSDGSQHYGAGFTAEEAELNAAINQNEHERYLRMTTAQQLEVLVAGDLMDTDQRRAIRLLAMLVLSLHGRPASLNLLGKI